MLPRYRAPNVTLDQRSHLTNRDAVLESKKHEGRDSGRYPEPWKHGEEIAVEPHPASVERVAVTV